MKKKINIIVKHNISIIDLLKESGFAKNKVKTYVKLGFIYVNNKKITKLPYILTIGDIVTIDENQEMKMIAIQQQIKQQEYLQLVLLIKIKIMK